MKLLVDIGNTCIKYCLQVDNELMVSHSILHQQQYQKAVQAAWSTIEQPESVWVANVAGKRAQNEIATYCQSQWQLDANFVQVQKKFEGIENHYQDIHQMGVDRWLAVLGTRTIFSKGGVIIIDAGTAVNIELLNNKNQYLGGVILPGMNLMHQALMGNTNITKTELSTFISNEVVVIGQSTKQCVDSGIRYGLVGAIERVVQVMQAELETDAQLLITGGGIDWLQDKLEFTARREQDLVLLGLARVSRV